MMRLRVHWSLFIFLILTTTLGVAQTRTAAAGSISGRIFDSGGGVIQEVRVTLRNQDTEVQLAAITDELGTYRFENLPVASYYLSTEKKNFHSAVQEISLSLDETLQIDWTLHFNPQSIIQERVMVVGSPSTLAGIPGSAHYIAPLQLSRQTLAFDDIHEVLRQVPGVNIQEEDGFGLRPNVGMRGSGSERSSKITLMEDGVLIAPAPYAAPAAYYFPITGRMEAIEVRKGSSQIKYGPRTNGGALNLISTAIPHEFKLNGNLSLGGDKTRKLHLNAGNSYQNFAWVAETYQLETNGFKELDGGGDTGFDVGDYLAKFRLHSDRDDRIYQELEIKLGKTQQTSSETYLGLTDDDFAENPLRRYRGSQKDLFESDHEQYQARYFIVPVKNVDVTTIFYRNNFHRNWFKLQSISGTSISKIFADPKQYASQLDIARGADSDPDALAVRANNRDYYSQGIQSILGFHFVTGETQHNFELGSRYHKDQEDRFQHEDGFQMVDSNMILTSPGEAGSQSNRIGEATGWAFFAQNQMEWGRWTLSPGFRYENIDLLRTDYSRSDPERRSPTRVRTNGVAVFIPGMGVNFELNSGVGIFGGIHKGFAPPGPGSNEDTAAEGSLNYEFGFRLQNRRVELEVAAFVNDYDNLLGVGTLSSEGTGEGDLFNGGEVLVKGLETSGSFDLSHTLRSSLRLPVRFAYTFTDAHFRNAFDSQFEPWGQVVSGDELPYIPRHQLHAALGLEQQRWRLELEATAMGEMRTMAGQGPIPPLEATDAFLAFNLSVEYDLMAEDQTVSLFVTVRNLTDNAYIVARRPAGARPGLRRTVIGGIKFRLGE
jgi:Fe(3+) dicitrate transport protein